jgi:hypothetical protein
MQMTPISTFGCEQAYSAQTQKESLTATAEMMISFTQSKNAQKHFRIFSLAILITADMPFTLTTEIDRSPQTGTISTLRHPITLPS